MKKFAPIAMLLLAIAMQVAAAQQPKGKKRSQKPTPSSATALPQDYKLVPPATPTEGASQQSNVRLIDPYHEPENFPADGNNASNSLKGSDIPFSGKYPPKDSIFTLPLSTTYSMPSTIQRIIMEMMSCYPSEAPIWRDEYKIIHDNHANIKKWLSNKLYEKQKYHQFTLLQLRTSEQELRSAANQHNEEANRFARQIFQQWTPTYESSQASFHIGQRDAKRQKADDLLAPQNAQARAVDALGEWIEYNNTGW